MILSNFRIIELLIIGSSILYDSSHCEKAENNR